MNEIEKQDKPLLLSPSAGCWSHLPCVHRFALAAGLEARRQCAGNNCAAVPEISAMNRQLKHNGILVGNCLKIVPFWNYRRRFFRYHGAMNEAGKRNEPSPMPKRAGCGRHSTRSGQAPIIAGFLICYFFAVEKLQRNPTQEVVAFSPQPASENGGKMPTRYGQDFLRMTAREKMVAPELSLTGTCYVPTPQLLANGASAQAGKMAG